MYSNTPSIKNFPTSLSECVRKQSTLFSRKGALEALQITVYILVLAIAFAQPAYAQQISRRFITLESGISLGCALRADGRTIAPAKIETRRQARLLSRADIRARRASVRREIAAASRLQRSNRRAATLTSLRRREAILVNFEQRCAAAVAVRCENEALDPIEQGVDCGGACQQSCQRGPQPTPTATPDPSGTVAPSPTPTATPTPQYRPVERPSLALNNECYDGIDNDLDGRIDFGSGTAATADFGCFGPNGQETMNDYGFTLMTPSSDTRIVYVSSSTGNDSNDGLSADTPKRTLVAGYNLLRAGRPDWLLLKRGDTFDGADWRQRLAKSLSSDPEGANSWELSGRSTAERMVVSSYGTSAERPILIAANAIGSVNAGRWGIYIRGTSHLMISGLDFYAAPCDPNSPQFRDVRCEDGIWIYSGAQDIVIEDNRIRFFGGGIRLQEASDPGQQPRADQIWDDVVFRRNIVHNSYSGSSHSQGIYASGRGNLRISQNILYKNGWNDDFRMQLTPASFNQGAWNSVVAGRVNFIINGITYTLDNLNFSTVTSYEDVADILNARLQERLSGGVTASLSWNGKQIILRSNQPSNELYDAVATPGTAAANNIALSAFLNLFRTSSNSNPRTVGATIYNRNMYLTYGFSNTIADGNIVARGASGGIQLRMGGIMVDNLALAEPVALSVGHNENPDGVAITAYIADNVVLGSSNIGTQARGFGIGFAGQSFIVERNIIAHNREGTGNMEALFCDTDSSTENDLYSNGVIRENVVYDWKAPNSLAGAAFASRHRAFQDILIEDNDFIQPAGGSIIGYSNTSPLVGVAYGANRVFGLGAEQTATRFSIGNQTYTLSAFQTLAGGEWSWGAPNYPDPDRSIDTYLTDNDLGLGSVDEFMELAMTQSRFNWNPTLSAYRVGDYIRDGFAK